MDLRNHWNASLEDCEFVWRKGMPSEPRIGLSIAVAFENLVMAIAKKLLTIERH